MGTGIRTEKGSSFPPKMISRKVLFSLGRSEEHTSELQSRLHLVCRLLLEKKKKNVLKPVPLSLNEHPDRRPVLPDLCNSFLSIQNGRKSLPFRARPARTGDFIYHRRGTRQ